jgi:hypothetical protein
LPRKYHRPPAVKRRKARRPGPDAPLAGGPLDGSETGATSSEDGFDEEWDEADDYEEEPAAAAVAQTSAVRDRSQHLQRDFSYVRDDLIRVAVLATFLVVSLVITSILR